VAKTSKTTLALIGIFAEALAPILPTNTSKVGSQVLDKLANLFRHFLSVGGSSRNCAPD
jgi:hypothetical protein